jgi:hypothetical protein
MDRLTPEQEAAARQTKSEKWLSTVKDFYSQKEKVEPFQFYPEVSHPLHGVVNAYMFSHLSNSTILSMRCSS